LFNHQWVRSFEKKLSSKKLIKEESKVAIIPSNNITFSNKEKVNIKPSAFNNDFIINREKDIFIEDKKTYERNKSSNNVIHLTPILNKNQYEETKSTNSRINSKLQTNKILRKKSFDENFINELLNIVKEPAEKTNQRIVINSEKKIISEFNVNDSTFSNEKANEKANENKKVVRRLYFTNKELIKVDNCLTKDNDNNSNIKNKESCIIISSGVKEVKENHISDFNDFKKFNLNDNKNDIDKSKSKNIHFNKINNNDVDNIDLNNSAVLDFVIGKVKVKQDKISKYINILISIEHKISVKNNIANNNINIANNNINILNNVENDNELSLSINDEDVKIAKIESSKIEKSEKCEFDIGHSINNEDFDFKKIKSINSTQTSNHVSNQIFRQDSLKSKGSKGSNCSKGSKENKEGNQFEAYEANEFCLLKHSSPFITLKKSGNSYIFQS